MCNPTINERNRQHEENLQVCSEPGSRCNICTGCGRCVRYGDGLRTITENLLSNRPESVKSEDAAETVEKAAEEKAAAAVMKSSGFLAAADIGTTTIAMVLYDGEGKETDTYVAVNPQYKYGADVLSRIKSAREPASAEAMRRMVREVLEEGIRRFRAAALSDFPLYIAANTTMVYLLMGWDPEELGQAPFHAEHLEPVCFTLGDVPAVILPGLSAFIGADIVAGIYACDMEEDHSITLFLDLGTNGEMVIGNREKMTACSVAAGPAFEGGISAGIWGADMISLTARLLREGIVDDTGLLADEWFAAGIRIGGVLVTQENIRSLQLAKGAVAAGIRILVRRHGLSGLEAVDRVILAGGFGYYLQPHDAAEIGLLPEVLVKKAAAGGNMALAGACRYGRRTFHERAEHKERKGLKIQRKLTDSLERLKEKVTVLNLALEPEFEELYLDSMYFKRQ